MADFLSARVLRGLEMETITVKYREILDDGSFSHATKKVRDYFAVEKDSYGVLSLVTTCGEEKRIRIGLAQIVSITISAE